MPAKDEIYRTQAEYGIRLLRTRTEIDSKKENERPIKTKIKKIYRKRMVINLVQIEDLNRDLRETLTKLKGIGESL